MKFEPREDNALSRRSAAFTLVDALFAMVAAGVMFTALYAGLAFGFNTVKMGRENTRATQIMLEHMEIIRLYTWDQLTNTAFVPTNFTTPYYSIGGTNTSLMYTGKITIAPVSLNGDPSYAPNMRKVTIQLDWSQLGTTSRTRSMCTYVTRNGLQTYVW